MANLLLPDITIRHILSGSVDWATIVTQFVVYITEHQGRLYANWAGERLTRAIGTAEGAVAMTADGKLLGIMLVEIVDRAAEMSFPWVANFRGNNDIARALTDYVVNYLRTAHPALTCMRAERQLLPGNTDTSALADVGFHCGWRERMTLELDEWDGKLSVAPYCTLQPWNIRYLNLAAEVIFNANYETLDAKLYAPFFGDSHLYCRKGLLSILAGKYGTINNEASIIALFEDRLVGVSFIVDEENDLASLVEISVEPSKQHQGVGRAMLTHGLAVLRKHRFERVELAVTKANFAAQHLYSSLSFQSGGDFPVCYWP